MEGDLTMEKWDTFTTLLQDYYLHEFLKAIYQNKDSATDLEKEMKLIILETAQKWK